MHGVFREEGADDILGRLLGERDSFESEPCVAQDGGDEVSAGDLA